MNFLEKKLAEKGLEKTNKKLFWALVILGGAVLIVKTAALYMSIFQ